MVQNVEHVGNESAGRWKRARSRRWGRGGKWRGGGDEEFRTSYCVKCSDVKAQQKSRAGNAKWRESKLTVRCSSKTCLTLFDEQGEVSDAQKKHKAAGERLCRRCAEERERTTRESNRVRCSNEKCLALFDEQGDVSDAQKKYNAAGMRLCQRCAEGRYNEVLRENWEASNRKRKAEADAKPLTCAPCGGAFSDTKHLKQKQVEHRRAAK